MKRISLYLCALLCTWGLMTSCDDSVTPDTISGTYSGTVDVDFNLPNTDDFDLELPYEAVVTKASDSYIDISLDLNLAKHIDPTLATLAGSSLDFGTVTARCLVGPTLRGETPLSGTATVSGNSIPVYGNFEGRVLDITYALGVITVEFEGIRR